MGEAKPSAGIFVGHAAMPLAALAAALVEAERYFSRAAEPERVRARLAAVEACAGSMIAAGDAPFAGEDAYGCRLSIHERKDHADVPLPLPVAPAKRARARRTPATTQ